MYEVYHLHLRTPKYEHVEALIFYVVYL